MSDKNKLDETDTFAPDSEPTHDDNRFEYVSRLKRKAGTEAIDSDILQATGRMKAYPSVKTRVSWTQRVLGWFRRG